MIREDVGVGREGGCSEVTHGTHEWLGIRTINRGAGQKGLWRCVGTGKGRGGWQQERGAGVVFVGEGWK